MSDPTATPTIDPTTSEPAAEADTGKHDAHLAKTIKERDGAKTELAKLRSDIDSAKSAAKEKAASDAGKWEEVFASKEETIGKLKEQLAAEKDINSGHLSTGRERKLMAKIMESATGDAADVEAHYMLLSKKNEWESAPEDWEAAAKSRIKEFAKARPELFAEKTKSTETRTAFSAGAQANVEHPGIDFAASAEKSKQAIDNWSLGS